MIVSAAGRRAGRPGARLAGVLAAVLFLLWSAPGAASSANPLEPPDTSSPRDLLESFLSNVERSLAGFLSSGHRSPEAMYYLRRAARCLDLSHVPPSVRGDVGFEATLQLKVIIDRVGLPPLATIPGDGPHGFAEVERWRIPHTELVIARQQSGNYLFSRETVDNVEGYYDLLMETLEPSAQDNVYERYIYSPGWMIPAGFVGMLPEWALADFMDQAVWQWAGLAAALATAGALFWLVFRSTRGLRRRNDWVRLAPALTGALCALAVVYLLDEQINITGYVLRYCLLGVYFAYYLSLAWAIVVVGTILTKLIIASRRLRPGGIDADLIRLSIRLAVIASVFLLVYHASGRLGISVTAVFASAGIAGVAVALAARETLANFFGGISIFMDRPFRAGDYIVLDSGERGEVKVIGMRSTRIQTRDDIMITVPNSLITNVKIINESAPQPHFRVRVKVGVAYGSDIRQVERLLMEIATSNELVAPEPDPRVRFRSFGDSSLDFELLCWARRPHDRGRLVHQLNSTIYERFAAEGVSIPFPQRDVHLITDR